MLYAIIIFNYPQICSEDTTEKQPCVLGDDHLGKTHGERVLQIWHKMGWEKNSQKLRQAKKDN